MHRVIAYRGFEIHVELSPADQDTFDVTFQIKGGTNLGVLGARGGRIPLRNGPFTERWPIWLQKSPDRPRSTCCLAQLSDPSHRTPQTYERRLNNPCFIRR